MSLFLLGGELSFSANAAAALSRLAEFTFAVGTSRAMLATPS